MIFNNNYFKKIKPDYNKLKDRLIEIDKSIENRSCFGSEMLGWVDCLYLDTNKEIKAAAKKVRSQADIVLIIGIGGSYLGAKMAIDFLKSNDDYIVFLGNNMNAEPILNAIKKCENKSVWVIVISKSGETLEISATLEFIIEFMKKKYGTQANERIIAVTGKTGSLKNRAAKENWEIFTISDSIGGRFSVLSVAGLLPVAISGANIDLLLEGAKQINNELKICNAENNICFKYAASRIYLYEKGYPVEILAVFDQRLKFFSEWWKQLFGESEGKNSKGIFPASALFSTDLHSLGQFIQEGSKILFETFLFSEKPGKDTIVPENKNNNLISGKSFHYINSKIFDSTVEAHSSGGVPCIVLKFEEFSEFELGKIIFFFEKSCVLSALLLGLNPFDQPGVENYKYLAKKYLKS